MPPKKAADAPKMLAAPAPYDFGFTIGADPEFTMMSGNRPMNTRSAMKAFVKGAPEIPDNHGGGFLFEPFGNIGWDGHPATGELRPSHAARPEGLVANIRGLFESVAKQMPFVEFVTLTVAQPTGGHIHLSIPKELNDIAAQQTPKWHAIERALASFLLCVMIGENSLSRELRRRSNGGRYGDILDFRVDQKFTHTDGTPGFTLEVRGPTAEWITSEKIALGTLAFMAIAWDSILKSNLAPIKEILLENKKQAQSVLPAMVSNFGGAQRLYLNQMRPFVRKHPAYREYKEALELILNPSRAIATKKAAHFSITEGWGIGKKSSQIPLRAFLKEDDIEAKTSMFPEAVIKNVSAFAWNDDLNVESFATALSKRCIALGWKPEHEYYLFGLKKGLPHIIMRDEKGKFVAGKETLETKEDLRVIDKKFKRLAPRAVPQYSNFLNPRTGEPTNEDTAMRVMVGIPYALRQKMDYNPIIRLILKYEKDPKAFSALEEASLPEGASKVKTVLEADEQMERDLDQAFAQADGVSELHPDDVLAHREARETEAVARGEITAPRRATAITADTRAAIEREVTQLHDAFRQMQGGTAEEFLLLAIQEESMPRPTGIQEPQRTQMLSELAYILTRPLDFSQPMSKPLIAYLICAVLGQQGVASVGTTGWTHRVLKEGALYAFRTPDISQNASTERISFDVLCDLLGVSSESSANILLAALQANERRWVAVSVHTNGEPGSIALSSSGTVRVNPDPDFPNVWLR